MPNNHEKSFHKFYKSVFLLMELLTIQYSCELTFGLFLATDYLNSLVTIYNCNCVVLCVQYNNVMQYNNRIMQKKKQFLYNTELTFNS